MVVSTENRGALPDLPADSIVEISCEISARGAEPIAWGKLEAHERGWLQLMKASEEMYHWDCSIKIADQLAKPYAESSSNEQCACCHTEIELLSLTKTSSTAKKPLKNSSTRNNPHDAKVRQLLAEHK